MNEKFRRQLPTAGIAFVVLLASLAAAGADKPQLRGQRIFICGHSFHVPIAGPLLTREPLTGVKK